MLNEPIDKPVHIASQSLSLPRHDKSPRENQRKNRTSLVIHSSRYHEDVVYYDWELRRFFGWI